MNELIWKRRLYKEQGVWLDTNPFLATIQKEIKGIAMLDQNAGITTQDPEFLKALLEFPALPAGRFGKEGSYGWGVAIGGQLFQKIINKLGKKPLLILDVGADWCWSTHQLARAGHQVVALDINKEHLKQAGIFLDKKIFFERVQADMNNLPICDNIFDVVIAIAAVHHATDLKHTLKEFYRVLRPRGKVILLREPVRGKYIDENNFGRQEKTVGIHETAPTLLQWQQAFQGPGFDFLCEISLLNFLIAGFNPIILLKSLKRRILTLPWIGKMLQQFTITDFNFYGIKRK
ncbi:class I SAM-dependent methyltransferase [Candidatus Berkelbacteria bacterium]|nr:class I SAM-dependent methyltransferase [Candidatus Berkelbacteria bacterium]